MPLSNQKTSFNYEVNQPIPRTQVFRSSGTWNKPANITYVRVCVWGGGGGGSNGVASSGVVPGGTGGGGGARVSYLFKSACLPNTVAVTVAAGGTGAQTPTAGGTSSFGSYISAYGGGAGANTASASTGLFRAGGGGGGSASVGQTGTSSTTAASASANGGLPSSTNYGSGACYLLAGNVSNGGAGSVSITCAASAEWGGGAGGKQCLITILYCMLR